jgi:DNA (cytosine-5)-methyltransferase 1
MKSSNPHSGCRQVEIAKCIDTTNPDPSKNQGGMAVVHGLVSKGNGDGSIAPTMTGDHNGHISDYTGIAVQPVCFEPKYWKSNSDGVAETQMATQYKDPQIIAAVDCRNGTEEVNDGIKALQILRKDYGDTNVLEWAKRVQKSIQKTDLLRQRVHESGISEQAENGNELDDDTLPRPELVAEWLMRDVRGHQEHRCSSQRRKPSKQPYNEPTKIVQELPQQTAQTSKELFNMWKSGQGLWILREALSAVQKMGKSICVQGEPTHARNSVRRLTPLEAERLQGFPDNWTNIPPQTEVTAEDLAFWRVVWDEWQTMREKKLKTDKQIIKWLRSEPADSARYKALGNSIALPPWRFVLSRIRQTGSKTLGSLFDGIGGFPLIWQDLGGQAVWASEIEPFPIAVTKARIG